MSGTTKPGRLAALVKSFSFETVPWWLVLRLLAYFYAFVASFVEALRMRHIADLPGAGAHPGADPFAGGESNNLGFFAVAFFFLVGFMALWALMVAAAVSASGINPRNRARGPWTRPTHASNPFYGVSSHLAFFHFVGYLALATGAGLLAGGLLAGAGALVGALMFTLAGGATLAGLYAGMYFSRDRFQAAAPEAFPDGNLL